MNIEAILMDRLFPIAVIENRYGSHIGGGDFIAIGKATELYRISMRISWVMLDGSGPYGEEIDAVAFWNNPPRWIAAGATPEAAIRALQNKNMD